MIDSPIVMFLNDDVNKMISYWLEISEEYTNTYLGLIMAKLGFGCDDTICVYGYNKNCDLFFKVNDCEEYCINMSSKDNIPVVIFKKDQTADKYLCLFDKYNKFEVRLELIDKLENISTTNNKEFNNVDDGKNIEDKVIEDKVQEKEHIDTYEDLSSSKGYLYYKVVSDMYVVELCFSKYELYYGILNRAKVFEYLSNLEFPVSIFDVYKKICEIAKITNIDKFSLFDLRILKWKEDEELNGDYEMTDLITLSDGELVSLMVSRNGKQIYSNNESIWTCDMDNSLVEFNTIKKDNSISFNTNVKLKEDNKFYTEEMAQEEMICAKIEVTKVKKLAMDTFSKKK